MNTNEANFYMGGTQVVGIYLGSTPIWTGCDPECECRSSMGIWDSENQECHECWEVWEDLGYSSEQDCLCQEFGDCGEEE